MELTAIAGITIRAARIGLGTWSIGGSGWGGTDEGDAIRTIRTALERGINLIDTAPVYGFGRAEKIVGKALAEAGLRERVIIATKVGLEWNQRGMLTRNASAKRVRTEVEESLRRLQTDVIDLYQVHWPDPKTSIEETAAALAELQQRGVIRAIGVSNYSPEQMEEFRKVATLAAAQPPYNLFEREIEANVLPYCRAQELTTLAYSSLCRGLLSGRMRQDTNFAADDIRRSDPKFQPPRYARYLRAVERLDQFARERYGKRVIHLAIRWLLDRPGVGIALWGARRLQQLDAVSGALDWHIDAQAAREIDQIVEQEIGAGIGAGFMAPP
jgi:aryl-alcohol dehydrogenase-like predicted oxidoreductase